MRRFGGAVAREIVPLPDLTGLAKPARLRKVTMEICHLITHMCRQSEKVKEMVQSNQAKREVPYGRSGCHYAVFGAVGSIATMDKGRPSRPIGFPAPVSHMHSALVVEAIDGIPRPGTGTARDAGDGRVRLWCRLPCGRHLRGRFSCLLESAWRGQPYMGRVTLGGGGAAVVQP
ncbi:hypothetical protein EV356DRAFT_157144 [Viridothelium virens]|uniref:Uncharacterized protein n=1 Tax=Viridothelium virens TaxID=1048519 RepID=A0A6A6H9V5_VIRVR|nr:hypothetical protein EV356DRAFT_157144 [Viridothelium virens]